MWIMANQPESTWWNQVFRVSTLIKNRAFFIKTIAKDEIFVFHHHDDCSDMSCIRRLLSAEFHVTIAVYILTRWRFVCFAKFKTNFVSSSGIFQPVSSTIDRTPSFRIPIGLPRERDKSMEKEKMIYPPPKPSNNQENKIIFIAFKSVLKGHIGNYPLSRLPSHTKRITKDKNIEIYKKARKRVIFNADCLFWDIQTRLWLNPVPRSMANSNKSWQKSYKKNRSRKFYPSIFCNTVGAVPQAESNGTTESTFTTETNSFRPSRFSLQSACETWASFLS